MIELYPGASHLPGCLPPREQRDLLDRCLELGARPAGFYTPVVRGASPMRLEMCCLGRHWNARTYTYDTIRSDHDRLPVQPLPPELGDLARRIAAEAGMRIDPDICLINRYTASGRLGLHQDRDERPETIAAGIPIVSISLGDSAIFRVGGLDRREPLREITLASGDGLVMGGPSRLRYHGIKQVLAGTAPPALGFEGRVNLTFRQY
jgi:alkylated DNA repair protein (DNA oxidative demethylase)